MPCQAGNSELHEVVTNFEHLNGGDAESKHRARVSKIQVAGENLMGPEICDDLFGPNSRTQSYVLFFFIIN